MADLGPTTVSGDIDIKNSIGGAVRIAYCNEAAPADTNIDVYLDVDSVTSEEVNVQCSVMGGVGLDAAVPLLSSSNMMPVVKINDTWYSWTLFHGRLSSSSFSSASSASSSSVSSSSSSSVSSASSSSVSSASSSSVSSASSSSVSSASSASSASSSSVSSDSSVSSCSCVWVGVDSTFLISDCGDDGANTIEAALNGTGYWFHNVNHTHSFTIDLGAQYEIRKVRARSDSEVGKDPYSGKIWVGNTSAADTVATSFDSGLFAGNTAWVELAMTGGSAGSFRYVRMEIIITESASNTLFFGNDISPFQIFDICACGWEHGAAPFELHEYSEQEKEELYAQYLPLLEGLTNEEKEDKLIDLVSEGELTADKALIIAIKEGLHIET